MNKYLIYAIIGGALAFGYSKHKVAVHNALGLPAPTVNETNNNSNGINYTKLENPDALNTGVHLMSASWCGYCTKLRETLKANNIPFTEYNTENDANVDAFYAKHNLGSGVPVTVIGGDVVYGYDADKLASAFQRNQISISGL